MHQPDPATPPPAAAVSSPPAASATARPCRLSGTWTGRWGGQPIRLQLLQFEQLVVGDLRVDGRRLPLRGQVDASGGLQWASEDNVARPHYRSAGIWRMSPQATTVVLGGGLRRRQVTGDPASHAGIGVLQVEARLVRELPSA